MHLPFGRCILFFRVSINPQTVKMQVIIVQLLQSLSLEKKVDFAKQKTDEEQKVLAAQGLLAYCTKRNLPYHLYADGCVLLVFGALATSDSLSKKLF